MTWNLRFVLKIGNCTLWILAKGE